MMRFVVAPLAALSLLVAAPAAAQTGDGSLRGYVRDPPSGRASMNRILAIASASLCAGLVAQGQATRPGLDVYRGLRWRYVGPEGNRTDAVAGVPGDSHVYYAGAASGGI